MGEVLEVILKGTDEASGVMKEVGGIAQGMLKVGLAGAAAGAAALGTAIIGSIGATMSWGETLDNIGDVLGTNAAESADLAVAIQGVGGDVGQLTSQLAFMSKGLETADGKLGPSGKALEEMGINFRDANGEIVPMIYLIQDVADKLSEMPDGIEKTRLMMQVFGKSGKDLSDAMVALSTDGLQAADEKAAALGLTLGEDTVQASIKVGRSFNDVKMMGQGLMVTLGSELMPVILPLIEQFTKWAISVMPQVREGINTVVKFVKENFAPLLAGIVVTIGGLVIPAFIAWAGAAITTAGATMAALAPVVLPIAAIGAAVALLVLAWTKDWGGIRTTLTGIWNDHLKPIFSTIKEWLEKNIPAAIDTLSKFWTDTLAPAINTVKVNVLDKIAGVFSGIRDAIQWVIDKIQALIKAFTDIKLPDWLTPGSPTPFELGLRGIGLAMADLSILQVPRLATSLNMAGGGGSNVHNYGTTYQLTANYRYQSEVDLASDIRMLAMLTG